MMDGNTSSQLPVGRIQFCSHQNTFPIKYFIGFKATVDWEVTNSFLKLKSLYFWTMNAIKKDHNSL